MRIGLDLSVIQTPHRMRGIGATAINFVNNLSNEAKAQHNFIIFLYEEGQAEALNILDLRGVNYEIRNLIKIKSVKFNVPGRLKIINGLINNFRKILSIFTGDPRIKSVEDIEAFIQFDQIAPLPRFRGLTTALILYDIIPYVMESDYLWSYRTARRRGDSRKSSLRKYTHRKLYKFKTKATAKRASVLIAISKHTKDDFVKHMKINSARIQVVHLGITHHKQKKVPYPGFKRYIENSWGYFPQPTGLEDKKFLLYVGGADPRRHLNDLVAAFNNLRAEGHDLRLVFAGDTMKGPHAIPIMETQKYMASSSYVDDMVFLGFVSDVQKNWLYQNTLAFVYPSVYEGFGLPILEAMLYGAPVITYNNTSITDITGEAAIFSDGFHGIIDDVGHLIKDPSLGKKYSEAGKKQAVQFSWSKTINEILSIM